MYIGRLRPVFLKSEDDQIWDYIAETLSNQKRVVSKASKQVIK